MHASGPGDERAADGETALDLLAGRTVLGVDDAWQRVEQAVGARQPFSLVRFNDGEGLFFGTADGFSAQRTDIMRTWFGHQAPEPAAIFGDALAALRTADVVGLAISAEPGTPFYDGVRAALHNAVLGDHAVVTDAAIHVRAHRTNRLKRLLRGLDYVGLITCRDVAARVKAAHGIDKVEQFLVPEEAAHTFSIGTMRHYPDRFGELERLIRPPHPGAVYLVGAGILGKIYCHWIRERGGIALDIGSVFDVWAGRHTRAFMGVREPRGISGLTKDHPLLLANIDNVKWPGSYVRLAEELRRSHHKTLATTVLLWASVRHPRNAQIREELALMLARQGLSERAVEEAKRATALGKGRERAEMVIAELGDAAPAQSAPSRPNQFQPRGSLQERIKNFLRRRLL